MLYVAYTDLNSLWCQWFGNVYEKPLKDHYINQSLDYVVSYNYFHNKKMTLSTCTTHCLTTWPTIIAALDRYVCNTSTSDYIRCLMGRQLGGWEAASVGSMGFRGQQGEQMDGEECQTCGGSAGQTPYCSSMPPPHNPAKSHHKTLTSHATFILPSHCATLKDTSS